MISSSAAANLVMLGAGILSACRFHNRTMPCRFVRGMRIQNGQFWLFCSVLNLLRTDEGISEGDVVALKDPNVEDCPILAYQRSESV